MQPSRAVLVSEAEFLSLPEAVDKIELIDGEVIVSPSPTYWHQEILRRIVFALGDWASRRAQSVTIGQAPLDVRFRHGRILQPDAFVLTESSLRMDHDGPVDATPVICIEVLSTNRAYDRLTKRLVYAEAGVQEYWVVDPDAFVERWSGPGLGHREEVRDRLTSPALEDFELDVVGLFRFD